MTGTVRPMLLAEALAEGDRLFKETDSYIFSIYKNGDTVIYNFELTDDLGYPLGARRERNETN
jgi:hypothetical protein